MLKKGADFSFSYQDLTFFIILKDPSLRSG